MFYWAMVFLVIAIVAGVFGFGGIASAATGMAKALFFVGIIAFVLMLALGAAGSRKLLN